MRTLAIAAFMLIALAGCSRHYHPLDAGKKAALVAEVISNAPRCSAYKSRLASPAMDDDGIDQIYHEATQAKCINKDI